MSKTMQVLAKSEQKFLKKFFIIIFYPKFDQVLKLQVLAG